MAVGVFRLWLVQGAPINFAYADVPYIYLDTKYKKFLSFAHLHYMYLLLHILPLKQSWDYSFDAIPNIDSVFDLRILGILCVYTLFTSYLLFSITKYKNGDKRYLRSVALMILPFILVSNVFIVTGTVLGERLLYGSTIGFVSMICLVLENSESRDGILRNDFLRERTTDYGKRGLDALKMDDKSEFKNEIKEKVNPLNVRRTKIVTSFPNKCAPFSMGIFIAIIYGYLFVRRLKCWESKMKLFREDALNYPRSCKTLHMYGSILHSHNRLDEAEEVYRSSLHIFDDNAVTDYGIAQIHLQRMESAEFDVLESFVKSNGLDDINSMKSSLSKPSINYVSLRDHITSIYDSELKLHIVTMIEENVQNIRHYNLYAAFNIMNKIADGHGLGFDDISQFAYLVDAGFVYSKAGRCDHGIPLMDQGLAIVRQIPHILNAQSVCAIQNEDGNTLEVKIAKSLQFLQEALNIAPEKVDIWANALSITLLAKDSDSVRMCLSEIRRLTRRNNSSEFVMELLDVNGDRLLMYDWESVETKSKGNFLTTLAIQNMVKAVHFLRGEEYEEPKLDMYFRKL